VPVVLIRRSPIETSGGLDPRAIADAYAHPLRGRVLTALSERPQVTIQAVAERLGEDPQRVRSQVDALLDLGLVEVTDEEISRGVLQRRYGAPPIIIGDDDSLGGEHRIVLAKATVRLLMESVRLAAAAGTLGRRPDDYEMRTYGEVDDACVDELADLHRRGFTEILGAIEEGRERIRESDVSGTEIISALFFFEAPLWGPRPPRRSGRGGTRPRPALRTAEAPSSRSAEDPSVHCDPQALAKAHSHPVRGRVLMALSERPDVTIREVAERLGESPRRVRHHVEALLAAGLAAVTSSENLSGVVQNRYGAGLLVVDDAELWSQEERVRFIMPLIRTLAADLGVAADAGTIARTENFVVRTYGEVDDACLEELADLHLRTDRAVRKAIQEGHERVARTGGAGTEVVTALFFFEAPLWRAIDPRSHGTRPEPPSGEANPALVPRAAPPQGK
jgi:DNA-binding transcriptional ArsR family regulator